MTRKWEALKARIARDQYSKVRSAFDFEAGTAALLAVLGKVEKGVSLRENWAHRLQELADEVYDRIMRWDVRCAGKLFEVFPGYLPKNHEGRSFQAELLDNEAGDDCDWVLIW